MDDLGSNTLYSYVKSLGRVSEDEAIEIMI